MILRVIRPFRVPPKRILFMTRWPDNTYQRRPFTTGVAAGTAAPHSSPLPSLDDQLRAIQHFPQSPAEREFWAARLSAVVSSLPSQADHTHFPDALRKLIFHLGQTAKQSKDNYQVVHRTLRDVKCHRALGEALHLATPKMDSLALANVMYGLGILKTGKPDRAFLSGWYGAAERHLRSFDPAQFAMVAKGLGQITSANREVEPNGRFLRKWSESVAGSITKFSPNQLNMTIEGFALMQTRPSPRVLQEWTQATCKFLKVSHGESVGLPRSLYSLSQLSILPFSDAWAVMERDIVQNAPQLYSPTSLVKTFRALVAFELIQRRNQPTDHKIPLQQALQACQEAFTPFALSRMGSFHLSAILGCLGKSRICNRPDENWMSKWFSAALHQFRRIDNIRPVSLTQSMCALNALSCSPDAAFLDTWNAAVAAQMHKFSPRELSNSLFAVSALLGSPDKRWIEMWFKQCEKSLDRCTVRQLVDTLYSLAKSRLEVPSSLLEGWSRVAVPKLRELSARELGSVFYSTGAMGMMDTALGQGLVGALDRKVSEMTVRDIGSVLAGATRARLRLPEPIVERIWRRIVSDRAELDTHTSTSIMLSLRYMPAAPQYVIDALEAGSEPGSLAEHSLPSKM